MFLKFLLQGTSNIGKENRYADSHRKPYVTDPARGNFCLYDSTTDTSQIQIRDDISETDSERRLVKRKVLR